MDVEANNRTDATYVRSRVLCRFTAAEERTSLIPETLHELLQDSEQQTLNERLQVEGQAALSREERRKRQRSLDSIGAPSFQHILKVGLWASLLTVQLSCSKPLYMISTTPLSTLKRMSILSWPHGWQKNLQERDLYAYRHAFRPTSGTANSVQLAKGGTGCGYRNQRNV